MICIQIPELKCHHLEADTRIVWLIQYIAQHSSERNIVVRANDTNILVLLVYHQRHFHNCRVWMDSGLASNNTRWFIDVTNISELDDSLVMTLPGFHVFTGSDFTAAFARQGKAKPFRIMSNNATHKKFLASLGESVILENDLFTRAEQYVCALYGESFCTLVTQARYNLFKIKCAPKQEQRLLKKIRSIDPTLLPPSRASIREKLKRSNAVALI